VGGGGVPPTSMVFIIPSKLGDPSFWLIHSNS